MSIRKQIFISLFTVVMSLVVLSSIASAQCSSPGIGGSSRIGIAVASDQGESMPVTTSFNLDLFSRIRLTSFTMFSWGRGPVGHPGTVRSSFAVLRERLGLKR